MQILFQDFQANCKLERVLIDSSFFSELSYESKCPVEVKYSAILCDDYVLIEFTAKGTLLFICDRCSEKFEFEIVVSDKKKLPVTEVKDTIDIKPLVSEAVVLSIPLRILCRPDCAGLCQFCGRNLNIDKCACIRDTHGIDIRLLKLKEAYNKLKSKQEE